MSANVRAAISQSLRTPRANRPSSDGGGPTASWAPAPVIAMSYPSSEQTALKRGAYIPSPPNCPDLRRRDGERGAQLVTCCDPELGIDPVEVRADGAVRQVEPLAYLSVR